MSTEFALSNQQSPTELLLGACPFLEQYRTEDWECGDTIVFGDVARMLQSERLSESETARVFNFFNELAERGDSVAVDALATGALETFNDNAAAQRMARANLRGRALSILEELRKSWGQPDYESD